MVRAAKWPGSPDARLRKEQFYGLFICAACYADNNPTFENLFIFLL